MTRKALRELSAAQYAAWFSANRSALLDRGPFHDPAWLRAAGRGVGFDAGFIGIVDGDEIVAAVPGFRMKRGPIGLFGSPLRGTMTSYIGPVTLERTPAGLEQRDVFLRSADFARRTWGVTYARFVVRDAPPADQPALGPEWHQQRPGSYRLDLRPGEEALFAAAKSHCRRNVRKAARAGVEIVPFDDADVFFDILQDTMRRHGSASFHPRRFFREIMAELPSRDLLWSFGARYDGKIIAAGLFLHDDREVHFLSGASLLEYGSLPTSYLLHWHAITEGVRNGLCVFNSEPSGIESIDAFKETFNPVLERRGTQIWARRSVWVAQRAYKSGYDAMRRVRSKVHAG
jgi:GNAT acetyltransferase-like protein